MKSKVLGDSIINYEQYRYELKGLNQETSITNEFSWLSMPFSLPYTQLLDHRSETLVCHKTNSNNISKFRYSTMTSIKNDKVEVFSPHSI
jgi:hypothetical protein